MCRRFSLAHLSSLPKYVPTLAWSPDQPNLHSTPVGDGHVQYLKHAMTMTIALALIVMLPGRSTAQRINTIKPAPPATAASVTIDGIVSDGLGRPLAAAEIIVDDDHRAISNPRGEFSIPNLPAGIVEFTARRIGYQPTTTAIQIEPGLTVHVAVKLVPVPVELGTMVIEGKAMDRALWNTGFYQRRDSGRGQYFDSDFFKRYQASLGGLMEGLAGIRVNRGTGGRSGPIPMGRLGNGSLCPLSVFVDGNFIPWATQTGIDDVVNRDDVLAVEVYASAMDMPPVIVGRGGASGVGSIGTVQLKGASFEIGSAFAECGAILVWTKPIEDRLKKK